MIEWSPPAAIGRAPAAAMAAMRDSIASYAFSMLTGGTVPFVAADAMTVEFLIYNNSGVSPISVDFWIDDLSFY